MLKPEEQQVFAGLVAQIEADDPTFARRAARPPRWWSVVAVLLWTIAPICIVYGGWTGLIEAFLAGGYGAHLMRRRRQWITARPRF
ncbi:DUF3040 domain-containing protein [Actinoplanes sp. CA-252034]|uniref:DUF3040 domain-containing protein n=1 Tax=Actinoplanes sp. CA-252034 TaxID=3239906 RepID=UPI003D982DB8